MDEAAEAIIAAENRFLRLIHCQVCRRNHLMDVRLGLIVKRHRAVKGTMRWREWRLRWRMYRGRTGNVFMRWKKHYAAVLYLKNWINHFMGWEAVINE